MPDNKLPITQWTERSLEYCQARSVYALIKDAYGFVGGFVGLRVRKILVGEIE